MHKNNIQDLLGAEENPFYGELVNEHIYYIFGGPQISAFDFLKKQSNDVQCTNL